MSDKKETIDPETKKILEKAAKELEKQKSEPQTKETSENIDVAKSNKPADSMSPLKNFISVIFVSLFLLGAFILAFLARNYFQTGTF